MKPQFIAAAHHWLSSHTQLAQAEADALATLAARLVQHLSTPAPLTVGISGAPGTGKSTLAGACAAALRAAGVSVLVLSLDDYYLTAAQRNSLAETVHPLLVRRGPPGTHDIGLLAEHISTFHSGRRQMLDLPRFDKAKDDRAPATRQTAVGSEPGCLLVEGWLVGIPAQPETELDQPVNTLESSHDPDGSWRRWTNRQLAHYHVTLQPLIDRHWHLAAPDWDHVIDWRARQEREQSQPWLSDRKAVRAFLDVYQRIATHADKQAARQAHALVTLDKDHQPDLAFQR